MSTPEPKMSHDDAVELLNHLSDPRYVEKWHLGAKGDELFLESPAASSISKALHALKIPHSITFDMVDGDGTVKTFGAYKITIEGETNLKKLAHEGVKFPGSDKVLAAKDLDQSNLTADLHDLIEAQGGKTGWVGRVAGNNPAIEPPKRQPRLVC